MTKNTRKLVAKIYRFDQRVETIQSRWAEAADMDAGFDAGEWSGPACGRAAEQEIEELAVKFGFASSDVIADAGRALGLRFTSTLYPGETYPVPA